MKTGGVFEGWGSTLLNSFFLTVDIDAMIVSDTNYILPQPDSFDSAGVVFYAYAPGSDSKAEMLAIDIAKDGTLKITQEQL